MIEFNSAEVRARFYRVVLRALRRHHPDCFSTIAATPVGSAAVLNAVDYP
jgi:hypothetical protein